MPPSLPRSERTVLLDDLTVDVGPALHATNPLPGAAPDTDAAAEAEAVEAAAADDAAEAADDAAAAAAVVAPAASSRVASGRSLSEAAATSDDARSGDAPSTDPGPGDVASGVAGEGDAASSTSSPQVAAQPTPTSRRQRRRVQREQRRAEPVRRREDGNDPPIPGATQVVEAATAEHAISQVHQQLGANARILEAKLVRRGGFGGFFAREFVQLHVAPGESGSASEVADPDDSGGSATSIDGVDLADTDQVRRHWITEWGGTDLFTGAAPSNGHAAADGPDTRSPVDRLLASGELIDDPDADSGDFAAFLRRHLGEPTDDAAAAPTGAVNGTANGAVNGTAPAQPPADPQGPRTWAEYLKTRPGPVGAPVAWPQIDAEGCEVIRPPPADEQPALVPEPPAVPVPEPIGSVAGSVDAAAESCAPAAAPDADLREDAGDRPVDVHEHGPDQATSGTPESGGSLDSDEGAAPSESVPAPCFQDGAVRWSAVGLLRLGLPRTFVDTVEVDDSDDDLAWTAALTAALRNLCGPLPDHPSVMVGSLASTVAEEARVPTANSPLWLRSLRSQRWVHLVVGGDGWRDWLEEEPLAVSWARSEDLPEAIRCAAELGLRLGFGPMGGTVRRAHPMDVALAVRELVDGR